MPTPALAVPRVMEQVGAMEIVNGRMESAFGSFVRKASA